MITVCLVNPIKINQGQNDNIMLPSKSCAGIRDNVSYNRNLTSAIGAFKC